MKRKFDVDVPVEELERQKYFLGELIKENRQRGTPLKAFINTYGCQMNVHDSEKLMGMLLAAGCVQAETSDEADVILFNTCCVREHAQTRVYGNVGALAKQKALRPKLIIGVCGCMMQQKEVAEALYKRFPFVDMVFGTHALHAFPELLYNAVTSGARTIDIRRSEGTVIENMPVHREKSPSAFVTIMYGCNNYCTYCVVPYVRGRERSRLPEEIAKEVQELCASGCSEITLLGQNVNSYGKDIEGGMDFPELILALDSTPGLKRLRFMTSHPKDLSPKLTEAMAQGKRICPHVHLPVQSGSDGILSRMNRHYTAGEYLALVGALRQAVPQIEITTDIIVGFPGETEEDFSATLSLVRKAGFAAAFTFMYSPRLGTPAAKWDCQIDEDVKRDRLFRLNELQAAMCAANNEKYIGTVQTVLVEGCDHRDGDNAFGKTPSFKMIYFKGDESLIGTEQRVRVNAARSNSLIGELVYD